MSRTKSFFAILIPSATVFFSSACIMIIELVAGRLIAKHLGASLYTWTSIIGVVLAGITIGNYLGGRIADKFPARKALASLFGLASVACVVIVVLNNVVGEWIILWKLSWPLRVFSHVSLVFLIPSTLLGTISPVVAKMALDRGLSTGRTIGDIYAWGAAGSIAGTFLAGFYLIAAMGTIAIIWTIAAALMLMGILYHAKFWPLYIWAVIFVILVILGLTPSAWAGNVGSTMLLRQKPDPSFIYEVESNYSYIGVQRLSTQPDHRIFLQDKLKHSDIYLDNTDDLQYFYTKIYAGITRTLGKKKDFISTLSIGGGGYVMPRYVEKNFPNSQVDVAEIDPAVTEAAMAAFGLNRNTSINTYNMDARIYIDWLIEQEKSAKPPVRYDFVYEDALNDYMIPYQLVTREFNEKLVSVMTDDGVYMVNLIDIYNSSLFLGTYVNTLLKTFDHVYVVTSLVNLPILRDTFVVVASNQSIDTNAVSEEFGKKFKLHFFTDSEIEYLKQKSKGRVLTDDYAPVENLQAPVARQDAKESLARKYLQQAGELKKASKWDRSIEKYRKASELNPSMTIKAYNEIALIEIQKNNPQAAIDAFLEAIEYHQQSETRENIIGSIHLNAAIIFQKLGRSQEAAQHFQKAIDAFRVELEESPNEAELWNRLGDTFAMTGKMKDASEAFAKALSLDPLNILYYDNVVSALKYQDRIDEAIKILQDGLKIMLEKKNAQAVGWFKQQIRTFENLRKTDN